MNKAHLMDDPFYSAIMFRIESRIHDSDAAARKEGVMLTDSNVKSCLSKVKILARGQEPKKEPRDDREIWIAEIAISIDTIREELVKADGAGDRDKELRAVTAADWMSAVEAVEDSLRLHTVPGSRLYLDYLADFIAEARGDGDDSRKGGFLKWWKHIVKFVTAVIRKGGHDAGKERNDED